MTPTLEPSDRISQSGTRANGEMSRCGGEVEELIVDEELVLQHRPGFGAWTYHLCIPGTEAIRGSWGSLKVSGTIDGYAVHGLNLAPRKGEDKIVSINKDIRNSIGKGAGDVVTVTLYLHPH